MPEDIVSPNLQQEITQLEQALAAKRQTLETRQAAGEIAELPHPKETLHEVIKEKLTEPLAPASGDQQIPSLPPADLPAADLQTRVQALVNTAFDNSIGQAVKQARASHNPALIDAFHDALVDELYQQLVERGKLEKLK